MAQPELTSTPSITIRFAGDSGDGMQLAGTQFTNTSAIMGNDLATLPEFPAEIRAPAGSLYGVSSFQIQIGDHDIHTAGDVCDILVAMNPAALKVSLKYLRPAGVLMVNADAFNDRNLTLAKYDSNPLADEKLRQSYELIEISATKATRHALDGLDLSTSEMDRCKNFYALGVSYWLCERPLDATIDWLQRKFAKKPTIAEANVLALKAGYNFGETAELVPGAHRFEVRPAKKRESGTYRNITGNTALAYGLAAAAERSGLQLFYSGYPITPASEILHDLAPAKDLGIMTFQAEDEIAAICAAIGASYGGSVGVTASAGPGIALKTEALSLAVIYELPLVVIDVQRSGPSTGMPTKTEQSDLFQALHGRHGDTPIMVIAPKSASDCFEKAYEAVRLATKYMMPVFLLSETYIAIGAEPWRIPDVADFKDFEHSFLTDAPDFMPYQRDPVTLARPWVRPGTPNMAHRIGGLEKQDGAGHISYDPDNHHHMTMTRARKIEAALADVPDIVVEGPDSGDLLVLGWGGTYGPITDAVRRKREEGLAIASAHVEYMNPLPKNLGSLMNNYRKVLVPELNHGQFASILRDKYLKDVISFPKITGQPLSSSELLVKISEVMEG